MTQCRLGKSLLLYLCAVLAVSLFFIESGTSSPQGEVVERWASSIGVELYDLGQRITKAPEIKARYKQLNARVEFKDGDTLIQSIVENVGRMLERKMDAVKCILHRAENVAEKYVNTTVNDTTYFSSKYSKIDGVEQEAIPTPAKNNSHMYRKMYLNADTHFYNNPVNTSFSSVHVPTNEYDKYPNVIESIEWSESLDEIFVQNYKSDPALSWQYFGSSSGVMRHYPSMKWKQQGDVDLFDCRTRSWYIEAATCSKDIVILVDNSGSMYGFRHFIARLTVKSILDTFSNNDFVNIYNFSETIRELVPCFKDTLVQATPENIRIFNEAMKTLKPEDNADVGLALQKAFELLEMYRLKRGCNETSEQGCNQAIMLITDGIPGNFTEIFEKYNWFENGTRIPVRVFTYLIGKEVTNVNEIMWMACLNRGYYAHIKSLDEVTHQVLNYISVIARPLVLQEDDHPVTWTHAYADVTDYTTLVYNKISSDSEIRKRLLEENEKSKKVYYSQADDDKYFLKIKIQHDDETESIYKQDYRLLTSIAIPAFDKKTNRGNATERQANLLGVAGTDIPIVDIDKLTLPYKLGVNGYSFIVSNNGYLLLHPDLRPVYKGNLKENYNSVDLTEIEMIDDEREARDLGPLILQLRESLVNHSFGNLSKVPIRFHYDEMRRVSSEYQDYYYAPLPNTPFSLGLVLPHEYGNTWIKVGDEIKKNQYNGINISDFFIGDNWKVHPEWVYCKYHYLEGHEFSTPEEELLHFLAKLGRPGWRWAQQYDPERDRVTGETFNSHYRANETWDEEAYCFRKNLNDDDYYCNRELVQLLVFDAKVNDPSFKAWTFKSEEEEELFLRYNASLRFVATMSGLTRWQFVFGEDLNDTSNEFGDYHTRAVDETWYKSAILQHQIDPESFVFSVPLTDDKRPEGPLTVTASHAIFPRDGGLEAPGSVVGFQFTHSLLYDRFMEITSVADCDNCQKTCDSEESDCFVIDNNGYIIISEEMKDTGRFFGEIQGAIMKDMVESNIFRKITVFDLQGVCYRSVMISSDCSVIFTPIKYIQWAIQWFMAKLFWLAMEAAIWTNAMPEEDVDYDVQNAPKARVPLRKGTTEEEEAWFNISHPKIFEDQPIACDRERDLYLLRQDLFIGGDYLPDPQPNCSRPYLVKRIPHTNLLLIVVDAMSSSCYGILSSEPRDIVYSNNTQPPCHKLGLNDLLRRRLSGCYTDHPLEEEMSQRTCGRSDITKNSVFILLISWVYLLILNNAH